MVARKQAGHAPQRRAGCTRSRTLPRCASAEESAASSSCQQGWATSAQTATREEIARPGGAVKEWGLAHFRTAVCVEGGVQPATMHGMQAPASPASLRSVAHRAGGAASKATPLWVSSSRTLGLFDRPNCSSRNVSTIASPLALCAAPPPFSERAAGKRRRWSNELSTDSSASAASTCGVSSSLLLFLQETDSCSTYSTVRCPPCAIRPLVEPSPSRCRRQPRAQLLPRRSSLAVRCRSASTGTYILLAVACCSLAARLPTCSAARRCLIIVAVGGLVTSATHI
jgi:hypothetical protein